MAGAEQLMHLWNERGIQVLVLLSFALQVELLILAELRRRMDSGVVRAFVWSAYLLAESTAIFVLGHLSVISRSPELELMALWAPFLLLHLGGQDNITAYAIEDNELWLRHLQTFATQAAAASYVLYQSSIISGKSLLRPCTILMFVAGFVKYGERVWALRCASSTPSGKNYMYYDRRSRFRRLTMYLDDEIGCFPDVERLLLTAQLQLDVPKDFLKGPLPRVALQEDYAIGGKKLFKVVEMQLSLMHDVFYTKAEVMRTWYGFCIRIILLLCTTIGYSLFPQLDHIIGYSKLDITVTYILLVGAVTLELLSLLRAMISTWTFTNMLKVTWRRPLGKRRVMGEAITGVVMIIRTLSYAAHWRRRYWSGSMGQHNLLQLCTCSRYSRCSKIARWVGVEDPWNTLTYSWSIRVSTSIKQLVVNRVYEWRRTAKEEKLSPVALDHIINSWGLVALKNQGLHESLAWTIDVPLEEGILIWHVATNIYLCWYRKDAMANSGENDAQLEALAEGAEMLSNYMLFLLAARPHMLPPPTSRKAYVEMCYGLTGLGCSSVEELASKLRCYGDQLSNGSKIKFTYTEINITIDDPLRHNKTLESGILLGAKLVGNPVADALTLITQVWVEMLCYAGYRCSANSHAKQLSNGGEFITIAAILVKYIICDTTHPIVTDDQWEN